jgi:chemotaxis protein MotA
VADPAVILSLLKDFLYIYFDESNGRELLKKIILREGLRRIRNGDTPRDVLICTKIFLGKVDEDAWKN